MARSRGPGEIRPGHPAKHEEISAEIIMNLIDKAIDAQHRFCRRNGLVFDQPCAVSSTITDDLVTLANVRGEIARFKIGRNGRLRRQ